MPCGLSGGGGRFLRASVSPADWVRRRAPEGGWGRVAGARGSRSMHNAKSSAIAPALPCYACPACVVRHRPRRIGSVVELCMPARAAERDPGTTAPSLSRPPFPSAGSQPFKDARPQGMDALRNRHCGNGPLGIHASPNGPAAIPSGWTPSEARPEQSLRRARRRGDYLAVVVDVGLRRCSVDRHGERPVR